MSNSHLVLILAIVIVSTLANSNTSVQASGEEAETEAGHLMHSIMPINNEESFNGAT